jgi:putative Mg2+ transporter-C (MgtC) family protein
VAVGVLLGLDILDRAGTLVVGRLDGAMVARLVVTLVLCGAVGLERSRHDRASGLRTHILVGLGACLITMAGGYGFADIAHANTNPTNLAAYVVSGIGFLGAGAILRHGTTVRGMTTAASLWSAAGIGIAVGVGLAGLAMVTVLLILFTLVPLQRWEARLREQEETRDLVISLRDDSQAVGKTLAALARLGVQVKRAIVLPGVGNSAVLRVELVQGLAPDRADKLEKRLLSLRYVERVDTGPLTLDVDETTPDEPGEGDLDVLTGHEDLVEQDDFSQEEGPGGHDDLLYPDTPGAGKALGADDEEPDPPGRPSR